MSWTSEITTGRKRLSYNRPTVWRQWANNQRCGYIQMSIRPLKLFRNALSTHWCPPACSQTPRSYLLNNSLSTHPPFGNSLSHWLCRCTANTFCSTWSKPPPSATVNPSVQIPSPRSGSNGSGSRLSNRHDRPSLKQNGKILNGGIEFAMRRLQSFRYNVEPQSVELGFGGVDVAIIWKASQRYGECLRKRKSAPLKAKYDLSAQCD